MSGGRLADARADLGLPVGFRPLVFIFITL
jgi:hypothetical protein